MSFFLPCSTTVPNFKTIRGGPWKNIQKFVELTWNDPVVHYTHQSHVMDMVGPEFWYSIHKYFQIDLKTEFHRFIWPVHLTRSLTGQSRSTIPIVSHGWTYPRVR